MGLLRVSPRSKAVLKRVAGAALKTEVKSLRGSGVYW